MTKKSISLEKHIQKLAVGWNISGLILTLFLSTLLFYWLEVKDAERSLELAANSAISSHRSELLGGGDVLSAQLQIHKNLGFQETDKVSILDAKKKSWIKSLDPQFIQQCSDSDTICWNVQSQKIISLTPIYFGEKRSSKWGYLYLEKSPHPNWTIIWSVTALVIFGMLFQGLGFYFNLMRTVRTASRTLVGWSRKLSQNPKNADSYETAPFLEIEPIESALRGLKSEIQILEQRAMQEGALTTLRGVGHDILNPVARMKRILGTMAIAHSDKSDQEKDLQIALQMNLKRLSAYAEQLKIIYKRESGDQEEMPEITDLAKETASLLREISADPEVTARQIGIQSRLADDCFARIPIGAFSRIVENLCSNSIHASLRNSSIFVTVESDQNTVSVTVMDLGHGVRHDLKEKIFEPNFTTRPGQGTGLGLYVVRHICEQYGGSISISSQEGKGTSIKISFPKVEVARGLQYSAC